MFPYEEDVKASLGETYDTCLYYCDNGKIQSSQICEIANQFDPRIRTKLLSQTASVQNSPRDSFRCVMSEWYNIAAESENTHIPFTLSTLIAVFKNDNVKLFQVARELATSSKETIEDGSPIRALEYKKPRSKSLGISYNNIVGDKDASYEVILQSPDGRQRRTSDRAFSPQEIGREIGREISGQILGSLRQAALESRRSIENTNNLGSIDAEDNHDQSNLFTSQGSPYNPEDGYVNHYEEVTNSVIHDINSSNDMTLLAKLQGAIQFLKVNSPFHSVAGLLEAAVQKSLLKRFQPLPDSNRDSAGQAAGPSPPASQTYLRNCSPMPRVPQVAVATYISSLAEKQCSFPSGGRRRVEKEQ